MPDPSEEIARLVLSYYSGVYYSAANDTQRNRAVREAAKAIRPIIEAFERQVRAPAEWKLKRIRAALTKELERSEEARMGNYMESTDFEDEVEAILDDKSSGGGARDVATNPT